MKESLARKTLCDLLQADSQRLAILQAVSQLQLPDAWLAAGFLRNLAWDYCHGIMPDSDASTRLNDVDIIYFDSREFYGKDGNRSGSHPEHMIAVSKAQENNLKAQLSADFPDLDWDIKNQARMHLRNQHLPYADSSDAMTFWPEKETAVGVRLKTSGDLQFLAPFGLARLFQHCISYNSKRERGLFQQRVQKKRWQHIWPKLTIRFE